MICEHFLFECIELVFGSLQVWLKKKGLASANKKANRIAAEGVIETYIHAGANLGVLIEVNCETDFVAKGDVFKELAANLAMQVSPTLLLFYHPLFSTIATAKVVKRRSSISENGSMRRIIHNRSSAHPSVYLCRWLPTQRWSTCRLMMCHKPSRTQRRKWRANGRTWRGSLSRQRR